MSEKGKSETAKREEEILQFWQENRIFEKSLEKPAPKGEFVFYDGPPFATGLPHYGHILASTIKDVVPRYKTMQGYRVPRRWGWDCHGLPIENLVEKKLGLKTKKDILEVGIDTFNEEARASVLEFDREWEHYIDRIGRWVDFKNSYKTMDNSYIESVWWALSELNKKHLLYEGRKVLMYCPHCETPLAKAEIAADNTYKDITEEAVTVKFKVKNPQKHNLPENTYLLAWTTTPWTLPGNVALAVGKDIEYILFQDGTQYILSAKRASSGYADSSAEYKGSNLVDIEYEPLFNVPALRSDTSYKVYAADFVSTDEGTGIVHTAVMYGEDDFALGQKEGLPMVQLLEPNGHYNNLAPEFVRGEYIKKAERQIKEDLEKRGLLYKRESHEHSYPHCWRCGTPLIYNAVASWFINIQKVKQKMLAQNEQITWVPEHLKHGRFKHIVESAPDWTISRNRFWASPLPMWKEKGGGGLMVVGSIEELLAKTKKSGNQYFVMRHGEAESNLDHTFDSTNRPDNHLTERGREGVFASAATLKAQSQVDLIIASPSVRTQETAKIVQEVLGLPDTAVVTDARLQEMGVGEYDGKSIVSWRAYFKNQGDAFSEVPKGAETYTQIRQRMGECLFELESRYSGKRILIVTHECPGWLMDTVAKRWSMEGCIADADDKLFLRVAEVKPLAFVPYPHNSKFELDLHRPYIDAITLVDSAGGEYERIPEVVDCWVESGAMPFASVGYPREKTLVDPRRFFGLFPKGYPADFIAEYVAQTRTWFYYMHAMGVLLFNRLSFRSVVSTGTILASDGSKMSKSKGNYTDPLSIVGQFGADALRFYLMGSVVMQSEDLNFRDEDVREAHNRVVGIFWNSYKFFELYKEQYDDTRSAAQSPHVLDRWIRSRVNQAIQAVTEALDHYDTPSACRALRACVDDYSTWYVRRSRGRARGEGEDAQYTLAVQQWALETLARLAAPVMPFLAEVIYKGVSTEFESVHLSNWPEVSTVDEALLKDMQVVRVLASKGLEARERAGVKVRQPLARLTVGSLPQDAELQAILRDELNIKEVVEDPQLGEDVVLDTELTKELKEEGMVREMVRRIQAWRKEEGLSIADRPSYTLWVSKEEEPVAHMYKRALISETGLGALAIEMRGEA